MDFFHYKVKQFFWEKKDGAVKKVRRNALPAFPANFKRNPDDESQALINSKVSLRKDLFGQNLHAQGDTITLDIYLCRTKNGADANVKDPKNDNNWTFIGEAVFSWKQCFEPDNLNQWIDLDKPLFLTDSQGRIKDKNEILSAELFVKARFIDVDHPESKLDKDGNPKAEEHKYGENLVSEEKKARREIKMGAAGQM